MMVRKFKFIGKNKYIIKVPDAQIRTCEKPEFMEGETYEGFYEREFQLLGLVPENAPGGAGGRTAGGFVWRP